MICDGYTFEEVLAYEAAQLELERFLVQAVGSPDPPHAANWAYTVGLLDRAEHPELIVVGTDVGVGTRLLRALGDAVLAGERFAPGEMIHINGEIARVGAVAPIQYTLDTFNSWHNLRSYGALHAPALEAVQIIVADVWSATPDLLLADPSARVGSGRSAAPNRATRRAGSRRPRNRRRP
jgi:hypothetical protein